MHQRANAPAPVEAEQAETEEAPEDAEVSWDDVRPTDALSLEVGYRLIPLVDIRQGGEVETPTIAGPDRPLAPTPLQGGREGTSVGSGKAYPNTKIQP